MLTQQVNQSRWDEKIELSADEEYTSLRNVLEWTKGFGLAFVQCVFWEGEKLIKKVREDLPNKRIEVISFKEGEEVSNLYEIVDSLPNRDEIDILFVQGIEYSFAPYIKAGYGGQGEYYKLDNVPAILNHLNKQRENFRYSFNICFVFLLPFFAVKYFIQRAPDFFDWRLGIFEIATDRDLASREASRILLEGDYDRYSRWSFNQRINRILEIESLIKEDLSVDSKASLLFNQGNLWFASQAYEEAIASYDQAIQFKPDDHKAWNNRGYALNNLGRLEEAIASYDQAIQFKPDDHKAWNNRGNALYNLGRLEEAITSYDQALQIKPDYHQALNNRGIALYNLGKNEEAIASFNQALQIKPDYHKALYNRGIALDNLGKNEDVITS